MARKNIYLDEISEDILEKLKEHTGIPHSEVIRLALNAYDPVTHCLAEIRTSLQKLIALSNQFPSHQYKGHWATEVLQDLDQLQAGA